MSLELEVWFGETCVGRQKIGPEGLLLGRDSQSQLVLPDATVSKWHVRLTPKDDAVILVDLRSTTGTFVKGGRVSKARLVAGDTFQVGPYNLRLVSSQDQESLKGRRRGVSDISIVSRLEADLFGLCDLVTVADLQVVVDSLLARCMELCSAKVGQILMIREGALEPVAGEATPGQGPSAQALCDQAVAAAEPIIQDVPAALASEAGGSTQVIAVPLIESGEVLGVLHLARDAAASLKNLLQRERLGRIGAVGGKALRAALQSRQIVMEKDGWRWSASLVSDRPDLFRSSVSQRMRPALSLIHRAAPEDVTVLIRGETGTGKEVVARSLHDLGRRRTGSFVELNCGALPRDLIPAELFGYERGAFTGAHESRPGKFELAHGGTLFLDEIGDMPRDVQVHLLRALETRTVVRLGGSQVIPWDARVLAATHIDLEAAAARGDFRQDLYYRLNVVNIEVPPLRQRVEDIELLTQEILLRLNRRFAHKLYSVSPEALALMQVYSWPGNVRELRNVLERAFFIATTNVIQPEDLPFLPRETDTGRVSLQVPGAVPIPDAATVTLAEFTQAQERRYIQHVLDRCLGSVTRSAKVLGLSRVTLHRKIKQLGMKLENENS